MKISGVLLFPIFIVFFSSAFSQSNPENEKPAIDVKVIGGLNYSRLTHDNTFSFFGRYDKAALNLSGGFSILYLYHEKYNFEVGLHYSKSGAKTEEQVGTDETGEEKGRFWFVQELKFVEIPILFI